MANDKLEYELTFRDLFTKKMDEAIGAVSKLDTKLSGLAKKNKETGLSFEKLGKAIAGAFITQKIIEFGKEVVDSLASYQMFMASLKTMLGGNVNVAEALNYQLVQLAKTTPFSLSDVREGSTQLLAYGFAASEVTDYLKKFGDVAAGTGQPLKDITYLMGTSRVQGRLMAKDIYQFTNRGIPVVRELAKNFKTTEKNIMDMVSEGKIGFKDLDKALDNMTKKGGVFFNLMEEQSKTVGGMLSNYGDTWEQLKTNIGLSQKGIIANTVSWATRMVEIMNTKFERDNFREKATNNLPEIYNNEKDERLVAYKTGGPWASMDGAEQKTFKTQEERLTFLKENKEWRQGGNTTSEIELQNFSKNILAGIQGLKPEDAQGKLNELTVLKREIMTQSRDGVISNNLAIHELAVLSEAIKSTLGTKQLGKVDPIKPPKDDAKEKNELGTGIETSFARAQNLYISIGSLIEAFNITTNNITESMAKIKDLVSQALLEAVNDTNFASGATK